jgi:hypothetical protein
MKCEQSYFYRNLFGRLVKITDNQNICFIGTKGIKSISSEKFTPLKVFDMASTNITLKP